MKNLNKILLIVAMISILGSSYSCLAQSDAKYTVLAPLPCIESAPSTYIDSQGQTQNNPGIKCPSGNGALETEIDFKTYVQYAMNLLIALSAVVAVVMMIWGGIEYMFTSSFTEKRAGLDRATHAVYGLLLVLTSYLILRTVDPRLVEIPNTLVPKITIEKWLQENVRDSFTQNLETEIDGYDKRRTELGNELREVREQKEKFTKEISDLAAEIKREENATSTDKAKIENLELKLEIAKEGQRQLQVVDIVKKASSSFNGTLDEIAEIVLDGRDYQHQDVFDLIKRNMGIFNAKLLDMQKEYNVATNELAKINAFDNPALKDQRNYFTTIAKLNMLLLSINSIAGSNNYFDVILTDGTKVTRRGPVLKEDTKKNIDDLQRFIDATNDVTLKEKMTSKKAEVEKRLAEKLP